MRRKLLLAVALGVAALWLATPANAYYGDCYKDPYGNCIVAPLSLASAAEDAADMAAWGTTPDQHFAYYVTHGDEAPGFRIMDFGLLKAQGLRACQQETNGMSRLNATYALQYAGGYTFEQANNIASAADTEYCPWNGPSGTFPRQGNDSDDLCCDSYRGRYLQLSVNSHCGTDDTDTDSIARCNCPVYRQHVVRQSAPKRHLFAPRWCRAMVSLRLRDRPDRYWAISAVKAATLIGDRRLASPDLLR